jgi:hypothetical protein
MNERDSEKSTAVRRLILGSYKHGLQLQKLSEGVYQRCVGQPFERRLFRTSPFVQPSMLRGKSMSGDKSNPYSASRVTDEEKKKVESVLHRFRTEASAKFKQFSDDSAESGKFKEEIKALQSRTDAEVKSILGDGRYREFMENITKDAHRHAAHLEK